MHQSSLLDGRHLYALTPYVRQRLQQCVDARITSTGAVLRLLLKDLFGKCAVPNQLRFMCTFAPLARELCLASAAPGRVGKCSASPTELEDWFRELDPADWQSRWIVDLHYFAGVPTFQIAIAVGLSQGEVRSLLRNIRGVLRAYRAMKRATLH